MTSPSSAPAQRIRHPKSWTLIVLHLFLSLGAMYGGLALILDPAGGLLDLPLSYLDRLHIHSFLLPGLLLFAFFGITPLIVAASLYAHWRFPFAESLNPFRDKIWSWTFSLYTGFALIIWIAVQMYLIQMVALVHIFYIALGLLLQIVTLWPGTQARYERSPVR